VEPCWRPSTVHVHAISARTQNSLTSWPPGRGYLRRSGPAYRRWPDPVVRVRSSEPVGLARRCLKPFRTRPHRPDPSDRWHWRVLGVTSYRRRFRRVEWAPMRYLKLTIERNGWRIRVEQLSRCCRGSPCRWDGRSYPGIPSLGLRAEGDRAGSSGGNAAFRPLRTRRSSLDAGMQPVSKYEFRRPGGGRGRRGRCPSGNPRVDFHHRGLCSVRVSLCHPIGTCILELLRGDRMTRTDDSNGFHRGNLDLPAPDRRQGARSPR
jgi:hypothetical protein